MAGRIGIAVETQADELVERAGQLARGLVLPVVGLDGAGCDVLFVVTAERLELREVGQRTGPVYVDFVGGRMWTRLRGGGLARDPLVRAMGKPRDLCWRVVDATAGLGRDAFLLAWAGCSVTAVERSAVLAALIEDSLRRAMLDVELRLVIDERFRLVRGDAREVLTGLAESQRPDVVYIDPMFSQRAKSAASKKEMRLTRLVAGEDADAAELFAAAFRVARHRVVVKRWLNARPLGPRPTIQYKGQTIRYDVYQTDMARPQGEES